MSNTNPMNRKRRMKKKEDVTITVIKTWRPYARQFIIHSAQFCSTGTYAVTDIINKQSKCTFVFINPGSVIFVWAGIFPRKPADCQVIQQTRRGRPNLARRNGKWSLANAMRLKNKIFLAHARVFPGKPQIIILKTPS